MKIELAQCSGFCFGVKRAIGITKQALEKNKGKNVYSLGHIIHNSQVVQGLEKEGLKTIKDLSEVGANSVCPHNGVVVISSHGAGPDVFAEVKKKGMEVVDATCPYVMSAQKIVSALGAEGYYVLIFGESQHPEVRSLIGFAQGKASVIKGIEDLKRIEGSHRKIGLVSQTTQDTENYLKIVREVITGQFTEVRIFNTICNDTKKRQEGASALAKESDIVLVIGGRMSANTRRLHEICSRICGAAHHIETARELNPGWFEGKRSVGIASGASTPDWIIKEVKSGIEEILKCPISK